MITKQYENKALKLDSLTKETKANTAKVRVMIADGYHRRMVDLAKMNSTKLNQTD